MRTIEVSFVSFNNDTQQGYVSDDGTLMWPSEHVFGADWKDSEGQRDAIVSATRRGGEVVDLEDGTDSYWFASMKDAERGDFSHLLDD